MKNIYFRLTQREMIELRKRKLTLRKLLSLQVYLGPPELLHLVNGDTSRLLSFTLLSYIVTIEN
jgi:hypothetical protein